MVDLSLKPENTEQYILYIKGEWVFIHLCIYVYIGEVVGLKRHISCCRELVLINTHII